MTYEEAFKLADERVAEHERVMATVMGFEYSLDRLEGKSCLIRSSSDVVLDIEEDC